MLSITRQKLMELIESAYEQGWSGCLEMKFEYAEQAVHKFEGLSGLGNSSAVTVSATSDVYFAERSPSLIPGYYSYFGQTSPIETMWVNSSDDEAL